MTDSMRIAIAADEYQQSRLEALQVLFADACNSITRTVREAKCWNRVALHHLVYRQLRGEFPDLGSQMACNVIYSVSRSARAVYQHPASPWRMRGITDEALPLIRFQPTAPVYFDRHTLSLKNGLLSLFTLDGRMRFSADLDGGAEELFAQGKLREIALVRSLSGFELHFSFGHNVRPDQFEAGDAIPEYILIQDPSVALLDERKLHADGRPPLREAR